MARSQQRIETERARRVAERQGIVPITDSLTELARVAGEIVAGKDVLAQRAATGEATAVASYERSLDRAHRILADMSRLNIEARLAALSESQVKRVLDSVLGTVTAIIERLGHDSTDPTVIAVVIDELRQAERALNGGPDTRRDDIRSIAAGD